MFARHGGKVVTRLALARPARRRVPPASTVDLWAHPGPFLVREVADALRCSTRHVEKLIANGVLPAAHLGRQLRIPGSAARRLAAEAGVESATQANTATQGEPSQVGDGQFRAARRMV